MCLRIEYGEGGRAWHRFQKCELRGVGSGLRISVAFSVSM